MDFDTTRTKDSYEHILQAFGNREADVLIGTQMIVKGHDFANVTLVGILAADMSLHVSDYHAAERTFALLTQAAGRAGRGETPGQVVIQTYAPEHYAVVTAGRQDYDAFYEQEIQYRELMHYPPVWNLLVILCSSPDEQALGAASEKLYKQIFDMTNGSSLQLIGPADASIAKMNDIYRKVIYLKTDDYDTLIAVKDAVERLAAGDAAYFGINIQFDFNPMSGF
jgi:primosomal protein N' (replication factor Y)